MRRVEKMKITELLHLIVEFDTADGARCLVSSRWLIAFAVTYVTYRFILQGVLPLALLTLNASLVVLAGIGRLWFDNEWLVEEIQALLFALVILGVFSLAIRWLQYTTTLYPRSGNIRPGSLHRESKCEREYPFSSHPA